MKTLTGHQPALLSLRAKVSIKANTDNCYAKHKEDIKKMVEGLSKFVEDCYMKLSSADALKIDNDEEEIRLSLIDLQHSNQAIEHHLLGVKAAKKKFENMLG